MEYCFRFAKELEDAIPVGEMMLFSSTAGDALEACTFLSTACQFESQEANQSSRQQASSINGLIELLRGSKPGLNSALRQLINARRANRQISDQELQVSILLNGNTGDASGG